MTEVTLKDGGIITLLLADGVDCPAEYTNHPLVRVLEVGKFGVEDVEKCFASNSRLLITTPHMPQKFYERLQAEVHRRKAVWLFRKNAEAIEQEIDKYVRPVLKPASNNGGAKIGDAVKNKNLIAPKGAIQELIAQDDTNKSIAEESRRLFKIAQVKGITTTVSSIAQAISKKRRHGGQTARPASAVNPEVNKRLGVLKILDDAIAGFTLVREYVAKVEGENEALTEKLEKFRKLLD